MESIHDDQIDVIAHACVEVNELIQKRGTDTMKTLMRVLLFEIGQEIARQQNVSQEELTVCDAEFA